MRKNFSFVGMTILIIGCAKDYLRSVRPMASGAVEILGVAPKDSSFIGRTICDNKIAAKSLTLVVEPKKSNKKPEDKLRVHINFVQKLEC